MYSVNKCAIFLNKYLAPLFESATGIRQGDSLSPTLFSISINDLALKISSKYCGVQVGTRRCSILLYADDIAFIAATAEEMQAMLTTVETCCNKWRLRVNPSKQPVVHLRQQSSPKTRHSFQFGTSTLKIVSQCRYLCVIFDECLNFHIAGKTLAAVSAWPFARYIASMKKSAVVHVGIANPRWSGKTFPAFPAYVQPTILRI